MPAGCVEPRRVPTLSGRGIESASGTQPTGYAGRGPCMRGPVVRRVHEGFVRRVLSRRVARRPIDVRGGSWHCLPAGAPSADESHEQSFEARHAFTKICHVAAQVTQRRNDERCKSDTERRTYRDDGNVDTRSDSDRAILGGDAHRHSEVGAVDLQQSRGPGSGVEADDVMRTLACRSSPVSPRNQSRDHRDQAVSAMGSPPTMPEPPTPVHVAFVCPGVQRRSTNSSECQHGTDSIQAGSLRQSVRSLSPPSLAGSPIRRTPRPPCLVLGLFLSRSPPFRCGSRDPSCPPRPHRLRGARERPPESAVSVWPSSPACSRRRIDRGFRLRSTVECTYPMVCETGAPPSNRNCFQTNSSGRFDPSSNRLCSLCVPEDQ